MSDPELTEVEQEQQVPAEREPATGPLVPPWFKKGFYFVFVPLALVGVVFIVRSMIIQQALTDALATIRGELDTEIVLESEKGQQALAVLAEHPRYSFLYCNQEILQNREDDPRMARALALEKALNWEGNARRREMIARIVENMSERGELAPTFTIGPEEQQILERMVAERRADEDMSYAADRITDVLEWLARGHRGQPVGHEKRRLRALKGQLDKKVFVAQEARALREVMREWQELADPEAKVAAERFELMLKGEATSLPSDVADFVRKMRNAYEDQYRRSMERLANAAYQTLKLVVEREMFLDHPHIQQYLTLLRHEYEGVRHHVREGAWLLRHSRFTIRYLSNFVEKANINPVMAVETPLLTKEEHERVMRRQNNRRRQLALELLGKIGLDYLDNPEQYDLRVDDTDAYVREWIVHTLEEMVEDELIGEEASNLLRELRTADLARTGEPRLFVKG